ncbi:MAG: IS982 family transposase, partial [Actinobacteria bacterium]|nr:IS982 family transposase [Actinomycetota bacterium]
MTNDLDALLTALYVEIDDHIVPPWVGRGRRPRLTDAELLTLAVAQVLLGVDNEHRWMRLAYCRLGHLFRYLPNQRGYHKRLKAAAPLLAAITHLARVSPSWCDQL